MAGVETLGLPAALGLLNLPHGQTARGLLSCLDTEALGTSDLGEERQAR